MKELIYNQNHIPRDKWRYGLRSSAATGCGWIATHNALRLLGYETDIPELIHYYAWQLPGIHGNAGTSFWGPAVLLRQWGFPVTLTFAPGKMDEAAARSDVSILFYHWRRGMKLGAHFVALQHTGRGYVGYNTFRNSTGPDLYGHSLEAFLQKQKFFGCVLIGIKDKRQITKCKM